MPAKWRSGDPFPVITNHAWGANFLDTQTNAIKKMSRSQCEYSVHQCAALHPFTRCVHWFTAQQGNLCHFIPAAGLQAEVLTCSLATGPRSGREGWWNRDRGEGNGEMGKIRVAEEEKSEWDKEGARGGGLSWGFWDGGEGDGCYGFLLGQQTGADSRTAYLSAGIPQPHRKAGTGGKEASTTTSTPAAESWNYYSGDDNLKSEELFLKGGLQHCCPESDNKSYFFSALLFV